jgi:flagellar basal body-associated protein FliL
VDSTHYQRIRLWSGITSIGANLAMIWGLALSASWWAMRFSGLGLLGVPVVLLAVAILVTLANLPFDVLSGHAVEQAVGRTGQSASLWFLDWIRGRFVTLIGLWIGMGYFSAINQAPRYAAVSLILVAGVVVILLFLLVPAGYPAPKGSSHEVFEKNMASESVSLAVKSRPVRWFDLGDHETVNGCITPCGFLSLSTTVAQWLTPREAALMAAREEYYRRSGAWILILLIVLVWTLLGILAASLLPSMNPVQAGLYGAAVMTTWCFLALFVWPTLNRFWMRQADSFLASLTSPGEVRDLLSKIERLNATDIALPPAKTGVFHPIPPLQDRLSNLDRLS